MHNNFKEFELLLKQFYELNNQIEMLDTNILNKVSSLIMETDNEIQFQKISEPKINPEIVLPKLDLESDMRKQVKFNLLN